MMMQQGHLLREMAEACLLAAADIFMTADRTARSDGNDVCATTVAANVDVSSLSNGHFS